MAKTLMVGVDGLWIQTESFGNKWDPNCLLISGAGASARFWSDRFCQKLAATGLHVIRYDHRDQGLSSGIDYEENPYTLMDLVADAIGVLECYEVGRAHVVGHSMGGKIAQLLAIHHPDRVKSFCSISVASVGELGAPPSDVMDVLLQNKPSQDFEQDLAGFMRSWEVLHGDIPIDTAIAETYTRDLYERSDHEVGVAWGHIKAQEGFGDLSADLKKLQVPALFIHGEKDALIPIEGGEKTAQQVPNATWHPIKDMGHMFFSEPMEDEILAALASHLHKT